MRQVRRHLRSTIDYIPQLYHSIKKGAPLSSISIWMAKNGLRYSNQKVAQTFKLAGREDLIDYFIKEEDIQVGDTIRSRLTARFGKVIAVSKNGFTITVHWDTGGQQKLCKEAVYKMKEEFVDDIHDFIKVKSEYDDYGDVKRDRNK